MHPELRPFDRPLGTIGLTIAGSVFAPAIAQVRRELAAAGVRLRPRFYLSDGFGCVAGTCNIGLLWSEALGCKPVLARRFAHLLRPRSEVLETLRHEVGHAFGYVHRLFRLRSFRRVFGVTGNFYRTYPDPWRPTPAQLQHFDRDRFLAVYCLRHPDDDFAVTFEVWLDPASDWRRRYRRRAGVLAKLLFVDQLVSRWGRRPYANDPTDLDVPVEQLHENALVALRRARRHRRGGGWYRAPRRLMR